MRIAQVQFSSALKLGHTDILSAFWPYCPNTLGIVVFFGIILNDVQNLFPGSATRKAVVIVVRCSTQIRKKHSHMFQLLSLKSLTKRFGRIGRSTVSCLTLLSLCPKSHFNSNIKSVCLTVCRSEISTGSVFKVFKVNLL